MNLLQKIWDFFNGYKTLLGMVLYFLVDYVLPAKVWYTDLIEIIAYALLFLGGGHKLMKMRRYGSKESK